MELTLYEDAMATVEPVHRAHAFASCKAFTLGTVAAIVTDPEALVTVMFDPAVMVAGV